MTTMSFNAEELKRKLDSDEPQLGSPQKLLKRSSNDQFSEFYSSDQFTLPYEDDEGDSVDDETDDNVHEDLNQQEQQPDQQKEQEQKQQPVPPQRKKPGRKPNPASPALRKAQNRAAQRAFRERKERHLRELENTIKALRESQYESLVKFQREYSHYRSLIEQLEAENSFLKEIAFTFECALNQLNGNNDATTKMKNAVSLSIPTRTSIPSSLPLNGSGAGIIGTSPFGLGAMQMRQANLPSQQSIPTAQQIQNTYLGLLQSQATINGRGLNVNNITPTTTTTTTTANTTTTNMVMSPLSTTSVSSSSPQTPDSVIPGSISPSSTFFAEEIAREITLADMKTFVASTSNMQISHEPSSSLFTDGDYNSSNSSVFKPDVGSLSSQTMSKSDSNVSTLLSNNNNSSYMAEAAQFIENDADYFSSCFFNDDTYSLDDGSKQLFSNLDFNNDLSTSDQNITVKKKLSKESEQILRMSKKLGQVVPEPIIPKTRYPLTDHQKYYLALDHDSRIDMIPCLHLRSRMIQYRDQYDLTELMELLINKAKCHGDPLDTNSWELPEEFFERYGVLVFQHCRIKSSLYKKYGRLPKDFDNFYKKGLHMIS